MLVFFDSDVRDKLAPLTQSYTFDLGCSRNSISSSNIISSSSSSLPILCPSKSKSESKPPTSESHPQILRLTEKETLDVEAEEKQDSPCIQPSQERTQHSTEKHFESILDTYDKLYFIEPNSFGAEYAAGSSLFDWVYDDSKLRNTTGAVFVKYLHA